MRSQNNLSYEEVLRKAEGNWLLSGINLDDYPFTQEQRQKIYLTVFENDITAFMLIPKAKLNRDMCIAAIQVSHMVLPHIPPTFRDFEIYSIVLSKDISFAKHLPKDAFEDEHFFELIKRLAKENSLLLKHIAANCPQELYFQLCLEVVKENGLLLENIPVDYRHFDICMAAVKDEGLALEFVPADLFEDDAYREICEAAISIYGFSIKFVPPELADRTLYLQAVKSNGYVLRIVPAEYRDKEMHLTAVTNDSDTLELIPPELITYDLLLAAVQGNGLALKLIKQMEFIPPEMLTFDLLLAAVQQNGLALKYIKQAEFTWLSPAQYHTLCEEAVKQCSIALQYVDKDNLKENIINAIGLENILTNNYAARQFIPITDEYQKQIDQFLRKVKHVVVTKNKEIETDKEMRDIFLVYSNASSRKGTAIHVDKSNVDLLLADIRKVSTESLNLVMLGHSNEDSEKLGGITVEKSLELLKANENINRVTLLGCNTAKSLRLNQEEQMYQDFKLDQQLKTQHNQEHGFGLILLSRQPDESDLITMLEKIKKDRQEETIDRAFVIIKEKIGDQFVHKLLYLERNNDKIVTETLPIDLDDIELMQKKFNRGKPLNFPKGDLATYIRGGRGADKMTLDEITFIMNILQGNSIFNKDHPAYQEIKSLYPFLSNIQINQVEQGKLLNSLLKLMVEAIQQDPEIRRVITVKGFTKALHVDTHEQRMHVTRTYLYLSNYLMSMFGNRGVNIDERKLNEERKKIIEAMRQGKVGEQTTSKSISFIVEPNPGQDINNNNNNNNNNSLHG